MIAEGKVRKYCVSGVLGIMLVFVFLLSGCGHQQFKTFMMESEPTLMDNWGPNGIAWNGRNFVLGDNSLIIEHSVITTGIFFHPNFIYNTDGFYHIPRDIVYLNRIVGTPVKICALAWEGECCGKGFLWVADALNKEIIKLTGNYELVKKIPSPATSPTGLTFDGKYLWVSDSSSSMIYKISANDGKVFEVFVSPIEKPSGLAWDCSGLWIIGTNTCKESSKDCFERRLLRMDVISGKVTHEIKLPRQITMPSSLVWVEGVLWAGDYRLNRVFRLSERLAYEVDEAKIYKPSAQPAPVKKKAAKSEETFIK